MFLLLAILVRESRVHKKHIQYLSHKNTQNNAAALQIKINHNKNVSQQVSQSLQSSCVSWWAIPLLFVFRSWSWPAQPSLFSCTPVMLWKLSAPIHCEAKLCGIERNVSKNQLLQDYRRIDLDTCSRKGRLLMTSHFALCYTSFRVSQEVWKWLIATYQLETMKHTNGHTSKFVTLTFWTWLSNRAKLLQAQRC